MKRKLIALALLGLAAFLPGCWDHKEVEQLGIVLATAIDDAPNGKIKVIVQNINPSALTKGVSGGGGGGMPSSSMKPYLNRSIEGDTVFEAIRGLSPQTPRQLFFAHNQLIIVSEKLAKERGLREIMDFFERNPQIRRTTWLLVGRGDLDALLDEPGRLENTPSQRIFGMVQEQHLSSQYAAQRLGEFLEAMEGVGSSPYTALVERIHNPAATPEHANRLAEGHIAESHHTIRLNGTAVFRQDRLAGWLSPTESRGLLWVKGNVKGGIIEVPDPEGKGLLSLEILGSKARMQAEMSDGGIIMKIAVEVQSNLGESTGPLDFNQPDTVKKIEEAQAGAVRNEIEAALAKAQQEYRADVFGFGDAVHRKFPKQWKEMKDSWPDLLPGVQVEIDVKSRIRRTGMITNPLKPGKK